jgi:DNA-binding NarL/FixJ family response regulator
MLLTLSNINKIEEANTLAQAKKILKRKNTDVTILDIQLPDGSGLHFLKWMKQYYPDIRIIMFSNHADEFHRKAAKQLGADYFFDKSKEFKQLIKTIVSINCNVITIPEC